MTSKEESRQTLEVPDAFHRELEPTFPDEPDSLQYLPPGLGFHRLTPVCRDAIVDPNATLPRVDQCTQLVLPFGAPRLADRDSKPEPRNRRMERLD